MCMAYAAQCVAVLHCMLALLAFVVLLTPTASFHQHHIATTCIRQPVDTRAHTVLQVELGRGQLSSTTAPTRTLSSLEVVLPDKALLPILLQAGHGLYALQDIARGLTTWSTALLNGMLPDNPDDEPVWPSDPALLASVYETFSKLDLPRMVQRHPVLLTSVLKSIVELATEFQRRLEERRESGDGVQEEEQEEGGNGDSAGISTAPSAEQRLESFKEALGESLLRKFENQWAPPLGGLKTLDEIFGVDHDLIRGGADDSQDGIGGGAGSGPGGFGLSDGIWKSDGWRAIRDLQAKLKDMVELRALMSSLGRRPSVRGDTMKKVCRAILKKRSNLPA